MNLDPNPIFSQKASRRIFYGALFLSFVVLVTAFFTCRKLEVIKKIDKNEWLSEESATLSDRLSYFETLWRKNVEEVAHKEVVAVSTNEGDYAREIHGIRQVSFIRNNKITHTITEFPTQSPIPSEPSLDEGTGDFRIDHDTVFDGEDLKWLLHENYPAIVTLRLNDTHAVILLLDIETAGRITRDELSKDLSKLPLIVPHGSLRQVIDHKKDVILQHGEVSLSNESSDEITHHSSVFGQWTIRYWYPRTSIITYNWPVLIGGILLATLIAFVGWFTARSQERALRLASERVSFVNAVSHELRTPLTNILLATDILLDEADTTSVQKRLRLIRDENQRLARMVENVLTFARVEKGTLEIGSSETFRLKSFLETCFQQFESSFARKKIKTQLSIPENDQLYLPLDPLSQIVLNLFSNIEKYAGENILISVSAEITREDCTLHVEDNGVGIPMSSRRKIFHSFERMNDGTKAGITGTGLGLSISRELAQALGGDLTLEKSKQGVSFQLKLPLNQKL